MRKSQRSRRKCEAYENARSTQKIGSTNPNDPPRLPMTIGRRGFSATPLPDELRRSPINIPTGGRQPVDYRTGKDDKHRRKRVLFEIKVVYRHGYTDNASGRKRRS